MSYYFVIIGSRDNPLYEVQLNSSKFPVPAPLPPNVASATSLFDTGGTAPGYGHKNSKHVMQIVAHASLDVIEDAQWTSTSMLVPQHPSIEVTPWPLILVVVRYLKAVDRFHEWNVSAWVTPGGQTRILVS